eukprot:1143080-Pelagomonas_calceolata.AAC.1
MPLVCTQLVGLSNTGSCAGPLKKKEKKNWACMVGGKMYAQRKGLVTNTTKIGLQGYKEKYLSQEGMFSVDSSTNA